MVIQSSCCCCVPLKYGCYAICAYFIMGHLADLMECKAVLDHLGPQKNEDEENKKQRERVMILYIARASISAAIVLISLAVVYVTMERIVVGLKAAAYAVAGLVSILTLAKVFLYRAGGILWLAEIFYLMLSFYFCLIWYSYGEYIEEGVGSFDAQGFATVTVIDPATGQPVPTHYMPPNLVGPYGYGQQPGGQPYTSGGYRPPPQQGQTAPYGGQGPGTAAQPYWSR